MCELCQSVRAFLKISMAAMDEMVAIQVRQIHQFDAALSGLVDGTEDILRGRTVLAKWLMARGEVEAASEAEKLDRELFPELKKLGDGGHGR